MKGRTLILLGLGLGLAAQGALAQEPDLPSPEPAPEIAAIAPLQEERLDSGSQLIRSHNPDPTLPLVVMLPYTGGSAQNLYRWHYASRIDCECTLLLLAEPGRKSDYATPEAWQATLARYETVVHHDLETLRGRALQPIRVLLAGFSMGGDLAWALTLRNPLQFDGALIMGSRMSYRDALTPTTLRERQVRFFTTLGEQEQPARAKGMARALNWLQAAGLQYEQRTAPGGHLPAAREQLEEGLRYLTANR